MFHATKKQVSDPILIAPTLQRGSAILTLQRHQIGSTPRREAFFSLPAQRKEPVVWSAPHHCERAALPLRRPRSPGRGTGGARTRCAQTVCPFFPVPHPADRLSAKGLFFIPGDPSCPEPSSWRGQRSCSQRGFLRAIVPTLQRGNGVVTLPRHQDDGEWDRGCGRYRGQPGRIGSGPRR